MSKRIKICRIIARLNVGGPAIHTILLTSALNNGMYESMLVCGSVEKAEKDMIYLAEINGVKPLLIPGFGRRINPLKDLSAFIKIYNIMRKYKPDIVHTHTAKAGAIGRTAALLAGVPVRIHTFHGHIFDSYFGSLQAAIFLSVERLLARFTKYIVVVSEAQKRDIVDKYRIAGEGKIRVVPLGLELEKYADAKDGSRGIRTELDIDDDTLIVAIVGRLVPVKNHKMFIDAAKELLLISPGKKIKFLIVGDGEERTALEKYSAEAGLGKDKVIFYGWKEEMAEVYAGADIVALTSLNEGTPVALIEALAAGKPVVATDVGGVRDVVQDGRSGYLVPSGDVKQFAKRLHELASDSEKRVLFGKAGRDAVVNKYSKQRLVSDIKRLYTESLIDYNKDKKGV
jgi:glycosyltransferase involved in cell wall biosynthesis